GEVERICDWLVAIDAGRLLRADRVAAMTVRRDVLAIEVDEGTDELAKGLAELGLTVGREARLLLVPLESDETYDVMLGVVVGLVFAVAIVAVVVRSQTNVVFISYLQYPDTVGVPVLLFLAVVAPELVCRDLRAHVLPLYFSRPIARPDYALAKLVAMVSAV